MTESLNHLELLFAAASQMPPAERGTYLDQACGNDSALRRRVEELLHAQEAAGSFLDIVDPKPAVTLGCLLAERPGAVIGPYKLRQQIGEGGFGVVFMAEQTVPMRRKVALKVIKPGMDTRQIIARFEAERQALAVMDHPNIARVLDAGTTDSGRPFFAMELVRGVPITKYCDENNLPIRPRLTLFATVCQAIQHAHTKGIIHRDIKPSNVLVAQQEGQPLVKVIDFGVAKAMGQQLTDKTLFTEFAQMIGTPLYMSPEQAELSSVDIDTRSDIYSLGVLLYELLTGTTPVDKEELKKAAFDEIRRIIREDEPPKPSTRISTAGAAPSIAALRQTEPARLSKLVRGELDWIVMKALEKDRNRRYETANGFAMDVQRYLADEQVLACPPSTGYRLRKFVRRNKGPVLAASLIALVLAIGIVGTAWSLVRATHAEASALREAGAKTVALGEKVTALATAKANEKEAQKQETLAKANAKDAKKQELLARRRFYAAQINLAQQAWEAGEPARVLELLESQRPKFDEQDLRGFDWYYLWRLCHRNLYRTLTGPLGEAVCDLAITPDGKAVVSGYTDASHRVWDVESGKQRAVLNGHAGVLSRVAISPDGKWIASTGTDATMKVWDLRSTELLATLTASSSIRSVAFSPDGAMLAAGTEAGTLEFWDMGKWKWLMKLPAHAAPTIALAYSPDGQLIATAAGWGSHRGSPTFKIWDITSERPHVAHEGVTGSAYINFSPDSKLLATCGTSFAHVFHVPSGELKTTFGSPANHVSSVAFSADGRTLAVGGSDRSVRLWEFATGAMRTVGVHLGAVSAVAFFPGSELLASGSSDGVKVWHTGPPVGEPTFASMSAIRSLAFTPDSQLLIVGSDQLTTVLDAATAQEMKKYPVGEVMAISSDTKLVTKYGPDQSRVIWDVAAARTLAVLPVGPDLRGQGSGAAFSPDGTRLLTWVTDHDRLDSGSVRLWNVNTSQVCATLKVPGYGLVYEAAFSTDGNTLATAHQFGSVMLWDATSGQQGMTVQPYEGATIDAATVAISHDGKLLAAGTNQGMLRLWSVETGQLKMSYKGHTDMIQAVAFSPDDQTLLSGSLDRTARLWDVITGQELLTLKGHNSPVVLVAFAADGKRLATASHHDVKLWLAATESEAASYSMELDPDDPESPRALNDWGDRIQASQDPRGADVKYRQAVARLESLESAFPDTPEYQQELAYSLIALKMTTDPPTPCQRQFVEIWRSLPADQRFRLRWRLSIRSGELLSAGRSQEAIQLFQQLTTLLPREVGFWWRLGSIHFNLGQPEEAIAAYTKAIELNPQYAACWNSRGICYSKLGQFDKAVSDFRQAVKVAPTNANYCYNLGNALQAHHKLDEAIAEYRRAIELGADLPTTYNSIAEALKAKNELDGVIATYHQAIEDLGPDDPEMLNFQKKLAAAYESSGHLPLDPLPWIHRGRCYAEVGEQALAAADFAQALRIDPDHPYCRLERAKQTRQLLAVWDFFDGFAGLHVHSDCHLNRAGRGVAMAIDTTGTDPVLITPEFQTAPGPKELVLCARFEGRQEWQLFWTTAPAQPHSEEQSIRFVINGNNEWRQYRVGFDPGAELTGLRFDPPEQKGVHVELAWIVLAE